MTDKSLPTFLRTALVPSAWKLDCPCCGVEIDLPAVEQDDAGICVGRSLIVRVSQSAPIVHLEVVGLGTALAAGDLAQEAG